MFTDKNGILIRGKNSILIKNTGKDINFRNEVVSYIKKNMISYPSCKIMEYKLSTKYTFKKYYNNISSNKQMQSLLEISKTKKGMKVYHRLLQMLAKKIYVEDYSTFLNNFMKNSKMGDDKIYNMLKKYKRSKNKKYRGASEIQSETENIIFSKKKGQTILSANTYKDCSKDIKRAQIYYCIIHKYILNHFQIENYIDIGCGDCTLTKVLGNALGLSDKNIYGADIPEWGAFTEQSRKKLSINIIDIEKGKKLPIDSNKFSFITAFMTFHHVEKLNLMLSEVNRILKPGGYLLIREHDAMNYADYMLCDIEHMLYEVTDRDNNLFKVAKSYYAKYYDLVEWDYLLSQHGFTHIYSSFISDSIYYELTNTRAFYAIYKKK